MPGLYHKKLSTRILLISILGILCFSCEKVTTPVIDYEFTSGKIIYYPDKHISVTFDIKPKYDIGSFTINWYNPDSLTGEGPFNIIVSGNVVLDFELKDDKNNAKRFQHEVKTDYIDSLNYDYRNDYTGIYFCNVTHTYNSSTDYYQDTLFVIKNDAFNMLNILTTNDMNNHFSGSTMIYHNSNGHFNSPAGSFFGYHSGASFEHDSIHYTVSGPLGYYYSNTYDGVKISE